MGPLLTAVLIAGRTASSFAAEIGTMKINEEISALNTMGLDPVRFLVVPRILATMTVTVMLETFMILFGLIGCYVVMSTLGYTLHAVLNQLQQAIDIEDCLGGMVKVFVFGIVIAGVGCLHGLKTRFGAQAVGRSTTQAVVSSLIMLVIVDGIFAVIYYILGI
jgi:phospholipid/cholesterol/gamma-HCH transport system permease protein